MPTVLSRIESYLATAGVTAAHNHVDGTYVAVRYSNGTERAIYDCCLDNDIPNPVDIDDLHTTIAYSAGMPLPDYEALGTLKPPVLIDATDFEFDMFGPEHDTLVVKFKSSWLADRHAYANSLGAVWKWPSYEPHITIALNLDPLYFSVSDLPAFSIPLFVKEEYAEPLKTDWNKPSK